VKAYVKIDAAWATNELGKPAMPSAKSVPYHAALPTNATLRVEQSPLTASVVLHTPARPALPFAVRTTVSLHADEPFVDVAVTVLDKPADPWPEAGWICLPFKVDKPELRLGRLGSIIDPAHDIVPGANHNMLALNSGLTLTDSSGRGVGLCPLDAPLVSLGEPGCWKYERGLPSARSRVYVNLFNNQWTTNFRLWNSGSWESRVRLWSVPEPRTASSLLRRSWEARAPLAAGYADGPGGKLPWEASALELSRDGVLVTAFGPNPDGEGLILRLWEQAGQDGACRVKFPQAFKSVTVQRCDLRGRPLGPVFKPRKGEWSVTLGPYAPASYLLRPGGF
jgi:hypothetical protein